LRFDCDDIGPVYTVYIVSVTDQWSPLNPEGKKQYDRNFMLQLRFEPSSVTRPANLPSLPDIILNEVSSLSVCLSVTRPANIYIYEIYNALIVDDGSNQRRRLLLGGGV